MPNEAFFEGVQSNLEMADSSHSAAASALDDYHPFLRFDTNNISHNSLNAKVLNIIVGRRIQYLQTEISLTSIFYRGIQ